jgi:RNA polymerase sigma-70 factor (ECF subfamily)
LQTIFKKEEEIEEALADSFFTIFTKLDQLKEAYAFEAWAEE